jgi:hypothetical protein
MASDYYWHCPNDDCREQVNPPEPGGEHEGMSYCFKCDEWVDPEKVIELDRDDRAYLKARDRGWED